MRSSSSELRGARTTFKLCGLRMKVKGIQNDSHDVHEGDIYVCEVGPYHNGHHFIPEAVTRGASLIIAKLMLPGAELAMVADIDPEDEGYKVLPTHQCQPSPLCCS